MFGEAQYPVLPVQTIDLHIFFIQPALYFRIPDGNQLDASPRPPSSISSGITPTVPYNACLFIFFFILLRPGYPKLHSSSVVSRPSRASLLLSSPSCIRSRAVVFLFFSTRQASHSLGSSGRHSSPPTPPLLHILPLPPLNKQYIAELCSWQLCDGNQSMLSLSNYLSRVPLGLLAPAQPLSHPECAASFTARNSLFLVNTTCSLPWRSVESFGIVCPYHS